MFVCLVFRVDELLSHCVAGFAGLEVSQIPHAQNDNVVVIVVLFITTVRCGFHTTVKGLKCVWYFFLT